MILYDLHNRSIIMFSITCYFSFNIHEYIFRFIQPNPLNPNVTGLWTIRPCDSWVGWMSLNKGILKLVTSQSHVTKCKQRNRSVLRAAVLNFPSVARLIRLTRHDGELNSWSPHTTSTFVWPMSVTFWGWSGRVSTNVKSHANFDTSISAK